MVIGALSCLVPLARAADTGWRTTGTIVSSTGWTNFTTTRLNTSDDSRATTAGTTYGVCSTYGFTIPAGATINGIEVQVEGRSSVAGTVDYGAGLSWDGGTSWTTEKTDSYTSTTDATDTFGGPADTWGRTWTRADFTDGTFQLRVRKTVSGISDLEIDLLQVRVTYSPAANPAVDFQQGASSYSGTEDTELSSTAPSTNHGANASIDLDHDVANDNEGLVLFNNIFGAAAGQIPAGSTIISASLCLYAFGGTDRHRQRAPDAGELVGGVHLGLHDRWGTNRWR